MDANLAFLNDTYRLIDSLFTAASGLGDTAVRIRPAGQGDGPAIQDLVARLSAQSRYLRFFIPLHELPAKMVARFTHADPAAEMTLFATVVQDGRELVVGMANYVVEAGAGRAEYAVVVADAWHGQGVATRLLDELERVARGAFIASLVGEVLAENTGMQALARKAGYVLGPHPDDAALLMSEKALRPGAPAPLPDPMREPDACCA